MIEFTGTTKLYRSAIPPRATRALTDLSLTVERGEVFGIAGPNGAGKTTMLGLLLGFLRPTAGTVIVAGAAPRSYVERCGVGYISEITSIPNWWTVTGALRRYARLADVPRAQRAQRVEWAIDRLGLEEQRGKRIKQLSKGNLQRVGIAQALLQDRELYVFDEPTHGLDPVWTQRFRNVVDELRRPDCTIVIASHNLDELERLTDRVAILDRGALSRIAVTGHTDSGEINTYRLVVTRDAPAIAEAFAGAERIAHAREISYHVRGPLDELNRGLARLLAAGVTVQAFFPARSRLEAAFREAVGEDS